LLVFDGDYVTTSVAIAPDDPLQACVDAAIARIVHHRWLVRRLSKLAGEAGFRDIDLESHGYVEIADPSYTPTFVDLGANALVADGVIGAETAAALRDEARRRALDGSFFAHIAYASVVASAPDKS
jgi:hypothetical protein